MIDHETTTKIQADILGALKKLWAMHPDLRFGQLIDVFSGTCRHNEQCSRLFHMSDIDMSETLWAAVNQKFENDRYFLKRREKWI